MNNKILLMASTIIAAAGLASTADAGNYYVKAFGGANWVSDINFHALEATTPTDTLTWDVGSDTGWVVGGAVGYDLGDLARGVSTELEISYRENSRDGLWSSSTDGGWSGTIGFDHSSLAIMANAWYEFPVGGVSPYVGGGLGWARTRLEGQYVGQAGDPTFKFEDEGFAWQLGAGVSYPIKPGMSIGLGYRYFRGPDVTALSVGELSGCCTNATRQDVESENNSLTLDLKFGL